MSLRPSRRSAQAAFSRARGDLRHRADVGNATAAQGVRAPLCELPVAMVARANHRGVMMVTTVTNIDTARGDLVLLTDAEIEQVDGGILPLIFAIGGFVAANAEFFVAAGAGAAVVAGFWGCATHYK